MASANTKDSNDADLKNVLNTNETQNSIFSSFGLNSFNSTTVPNIPLFSPLVDMNSTQALLNMVRTASSGSVNQLENYIKSATNKRPPDVINNPLDLSSNAPLCKKPKRLSCGPNELFSSENVVPVLQKTKDRAQKRTGSVSPKPCTKSIFSVPSTQPDRPTMCLSMCMSSLDRTCPSRDGTENISHWSIDDVCNFVSSIDICAEYSEVSTRTHFSYFCFELLMILPMTL